MKPTFLLDPETGQKYSTHHAGVAGVYTVTEMSDPLSSRIDEGLEQKRGTLEKTLRELIRQKKELEGNNSRLLQVQKIFARLPSYYKEETFTTLDRFTTEGAPRYTLVTEDSNRMAYPFSLIPTGHLKLVITASGRLGHICGGTYKEVLLAWSEEELYQHLEKAAHREACHDWFRRMMEQTGWEPETPFYGDALRRWNAQRLEVVEKTLPHYEEQLRKLKEEKMQLQPQ